MATTITPTVQSVMGALLMELLNGQLSDETIAAVDRISRDEVPVPLRDVVGYIHGMSMVPHLRAGIVSDLLSELADGCERLAAQQGK